MSKVRLVNKQDVHKNKEENVLLHHLHRSLPITIPAAHFDNIICPRAGAKAKNLLLQHYFPVKRQGVRAFYVLAGINGIIRKNIIQPMIASAQYTEEEMTELLNSYVEDEASGKFFLKQDLNIFDEIRIRTLMKRRELKTTDQNYREKIAHILEQIEELPKQEIFTANMYVNTKHPFFFEHHCDHVPALMIMEAARQFMIACGHRFGRIPYKGMRQLLSNLSIKFIQYLELNFPVKLIGEITNLRLSREKIWTHVEFRISFYQMNEQAAEVTFLGKSMSEKFFVTLRKPKLDYGYNPRFHLNEDINGDFVLRDKDKNEYVCRLVNISYKGFQIETDSELEFVDYGEEYEFYAFFREVGMIHGQGTLRWIKYDKDETPFRAGFIFKEEGLSRNDFRNLDIAIKKHCYVSKDRKYVDTMGKEDSPLN